MANSLAKSSFVDRVVSDNYRSGMEDEEQVGCPDVIASETVVTTTTQYDPSLHAGRHVKPITREEALATQIAGTTLLTTSGRYDVLVKIILIVSTIQCEWHTEFLKFYRKATSPLPMNHDNLSGFHSIFKNNKHFSEIFHIWPTWVLSVWRPLSGTRKQRVINQAQIQIQIRASVSAFVHRS